MTRILLKASFVAALAGLLALAPAHVQASPVLVNAGQTVNPGLTAANPGTLIASLSGTFATTGGTSGSVIGTYITAVYRNALGFLDFYYQVTNTTPNAAGNSALAISGVAGFNFSSQFTTSVGYVTQAFGVFASGGTKPPITASRSANSQVVQFWFGPPFGTNKVYTGQTSNILLIATNSRGNIVRGNVHIQNSGQTVVPGFQVPEPASATVALMGLLGLAGLRRRQRK